MSTDSPSAEDTPTVKPDNQFNDIAPEVPAAPETAAPDNVYTESSPKAAAPDNIYTDSTPEG